MDTVLILFGTGGFVWLAYLAHIRLRLSRAKHASLTGHAKWSKRIARLLPFYEFDTTNFTAVDAAPQEINQKRQQGFFALAERFETKYAQTRCATAHLGDALPDLDFTARYRVPFQFSRIVQEHLSSGSMVATAEGVTLTDLDGNRFYDLTGSYGVNLMGVDFYRTAILQATRSVDALGPTLGSLHPLVARNVERLTRISGLPQVSFHMSGTEAVMQAVRLARYHTGRTKLVRFCGAYHGWWGDVQPGIGNPINEAHTYTLADMSQAALRVLETRKDIACVLINPLQGLHPNSNAPGDSTLVDSSRDAHYDRAAYTSWLKKIRDVCTRRRIVLVFDEVFVGFRLAPRGAQEYFGIQADLVTYGKTLGGGLPVGVLCGQTDLMRRYRVDHPADICFARGTFNSHPYVMAAMDQFLTALEQSETAAHYENLDMLWDARALQLNERLAKHGLPVRVANFSTIWTVLYSQPSRYNWMFQYYLKDAGLALSWVGSGRMIFNFAFTEDDFVAVSDRFVEAAQAMAADGWWWSAPNTTNKDIKRQILRESIQAFIKG